MAIPDDLLRDVNEDVSGAEELSVRGSSVWTFRVPGARAYAIWETLRRQHAATGHWPVMTGRERISSEFLFDRVEPPPQDAVVLLQGRHDRQFSIDDPEYSRAAHERSVGPFAWTLEAAQAFERDIEEPVDRWPAEERLTVLRDARTGRAPERMYMALVETDSPYDAAATLGFGGYNNCPTPLQHRTVLRRWHEAYGLEAATVENAGVLEFVVNRPPKTSAQALVLATEQSAYCWDIVDQGTRTVARLAATLTNSPTWYFWWD